MEFNKFFENVMNEMTSTFEKTSKEYDEQMKKFEEEMEKANKEADATKEDADDNVESYFYSKSDVYEDGKHVKHTEKEIKNGEVTKDIVSNFDHALADDSADYCSKLSCKKDDNPLEKVAEKSVTAVENEALKAENERLRLANNKLDTLNVYQKECIEKRDAKIKELVGKLAKIKQMIIGLPV